VTTAPEQETNGAPVPQTYDELLAAFEEEKAKAERYLSSWQRAQADFANLRRRTEQERLETSKYAGANTLRYVLPVVDDLERALGSVTPSMAGMSWVDGIQIIYRKLLQTLESQGLQEIEALGARFDPLLHEAVHFIEGEEGLVVGVVQKGYRVEDRVIRPAMVVVGKGGSANQGTGGESRTE